VGGLPKCLICGKAFHRVTTHVRQVHNMTAREYKKEFGLDLIKGITSDESRIKSSEAVKRNYKTVVVGNLLQAGEKNRFKPGCAGRTKEMVSEQTRERLIYQAKNNLTPAARKELGRKLGESGAGNRKRWRRDEEI